MSSTKRRLTGLVSASAMIAVIAVTSMPIAALAAQPTGKPTSPAASYRNGFEKATDVAFAIDGTVPGTAAIFNVTRVEKSNALKSAAGGRDA